MSEKTLFSFIFRCFWMKYKGDDHAMAHANITSVLIQSRNDFKLQLWNMPTGGFGDFLLRLQLCESWPFSTVFCFILFQKIVSMLLTKYFFWCTIKEQCFQGRKCLGHDGGSYGRDGRHSHRWLCDVKSASFLCCVDPKRTISVTSWSLSPQNGTWSSLWQAWLPTGRGPRATRRRRTRTASLKILNKLEIFIRINLTWCKAKTSSQRTVRICQLAARRSS